MNNNSVIKKLTFLGSKFIILDIVVTGKPTVPNAVGVVFAIKQMIAALIGVNPNETIIAAGIATAVPYPATPSINPPNPHASNNACARLSFVIFPNIFFITFISPVFTDNSYANIAAITTIPIGIHATANPSAIEPNIPPTGILHSLTIKLSNTATPKLVYALIVGDNLNTANIIKKSTIGINPIKNKLIFLLLKYNLHSFSCKSYSSSFFIK